MVPKTDYVGCFDWIDAFWRGANCNLALYISHFKCYKGTLLAIWCENWFWLTRKFFKNEIFVFLDQKLSKYDVFRPKKPFFMTIFDHDCTQKYASLKIWPFLLIFTDFRHDLTIFSYHFATIGQVSSGKARALWSLMWGVRWYMSKFRFGPTGAKWFLST